MAGWFLHRGRVLDLTGALTATLSAGTDEISFILFNDCDFQVTVPYTLSNDQVDSFIRVHSEHKGSGVFRTPATGKGIVVEPGSAVIVEFQRNATTSDTDITFNDPIVARSRLARSESERVYVMSLSTLHDDLEGA